MDREPLDLNKSPLTHRCTATAARRFWKSYRAELKAAKADRKKREEQQRLRLGLSE